MIAAAERGYGQTLVVSLTIALSYRYIIVGDITFWMIEDIPGAPACLKGYPVGKGR